MTWKYVTLGHYLDGVPARDLTDDEWARLSKGQQSAARKIYKLIRNRPRKIVINRSTKKTPDHRKEV